MASRTPWTHFYVSPETGRVTGFTVEQCEACGGRTQAANSITLVETPARLQGLGMVRATELPPEEYHVEELGHAACEDCIATNGWE